MKKILTVIALTISFSAMAQAHGYWRHDGRGGWNWVAPALVGGVIGYEIARPPVVVEQQPVIVQQPVVTTQQMCSPWTQIQNPDGSITTTRTCQ